MSPVDRAEVAVVFLILWVGAAVTVYIVAGAFAGCLAVGLSALAYLVGAYTPVRPR